jgi:hypothetical protein
MNEKKRYTQERKTIANQKGTAKPKNLSNGSQKHWA